MMNKNTRRWLMLSGALSSAMCAALYVIGKRQREKNAHLVHNSKAVTAQAVEQLEVPAQSTLIDVGNVRLHTVTAGSPDAPLVVLLHGFPEHWYTWRNQIPPLVKAGYCVVVPDQRGYNLSDKSQDLCAYHVSQLVDDVRGLIHALGRERAIIVGHDWGGVVAWRLAMDAPKTVDKLVVMNAPHPAAFTRALQSNWTQRLKSWYILFFQLPWLPDALLTFSPMASARLFFQHTAIRQKAFSKEDLEVMATALAQPGAATAMLNWYRAALRCPNNGEAHVITSPTLLLWGEEDVALHKSLTYDLADWIPDLRVQYILNCGHWVQNEAPDEVNTRMLAFMTGKGA